MKKKLLLVLSIMAVLACLFAVSVSATEFTSEFTSEVTTFGDSAPEWANIEDKTSTAVLKLADGTFVRIPAYYVFKAKYDNSFDSVNGSNFDFTWVSKKLTLSEGETLSCANLVAIEVPQGTKSFTGGTSISSTTFSALEEIVVPTSASLASKMLRGNKVVKRVYVKQTMGEDGSIIGATAVPDYFADTQAAIEFFAFELDYATWFGDSAFNASQLREFKCAGPITKIGGYAFASCPNLEKIDINNTGAIISGGNHCMALNPMLTSVTLNGISLTDYMIKESKGLTGGLRVVATNVGYIGKMVLSGSTNIEHVEIYGNFTSIGSSLFNGSHNLKTAIIENTGNVVSAEYMFNELKGIEDVTLRNIDIGKRMFYKVTTITNLDIEGFTQIGEEAFTNATFVTSFTVPAGFTSIGHRAFQNCSNLETINFAGASAANATFGDAVFENCTKLTTLNIPEGVTTLGNCVCKKAGLTTLSLPSTLTAMTGGEHFNGTSLTSITGFENTKITSIPTSSFRGFSNWKPDVLRIPDTVTEIGAWGLADVGAKTIILGAGVKTLGQEAFKNCLSVEAYYLPDTIETIGKEAFAFGSGKNHKTGNILYFVVSTDSDYVATISTAVGVSNMATYKDYAENTENYASGKYVITGINKCDAFYNGKHAAAENQSIMVESYFDVIKVGSACTRNCGNIAISATYNPIFCDYGYSCTEESIGGVYSMSQFYGVDTAALEAYKTLTGKSFEYGLVASGSANPLSIVEGELTVAEKAFTKDSATFAHNFFGIKINGMTEGNLNTDIVFCAYVVDGDKVYYLDNGTTSQSASGIDYTGVLAIVKAAEGNK